MPASRRHHRTLAVLVNGLGVLAALPVLPTAAPATGAAAAPAAAPATAPATGAAAATRTAVPVGTPTAGPQGRAGRQEHPGSFGQPAAPARPAAPGAAATGAVIPVTPAVPAPGMATTANPGARRADPPLTVAVTPAGTPVPGYRIQVRNTGATAIDTMVRQELPPGASTTAVSAGGLVTRPGGRNGTGEVTWRLTVPAGATRTLDTALAPTAPGQSLTAPACAFTGDGDRPYDCGTATWQAVGTVPQTQVTAAPAWRRPPVLAAALAALLVLVAGGVWWALRARARRGRPTDTGPGQPAHGPGQPGHGPGQPGHGPGQPGHGPGQPAHGPGGPGYGPGQPAHGPGGPGYGPAATPRGTTYPRPAAPGGVARRRTPPVWLVVGVAAAVLAGVVFAAVWTGTQQVAAIDTGKQPTAGAWAGQGATGAVGTPLREKSFEFTVYRVSCATAKAASQQCQATVGVRNLTPEQQPWHGQLQRAYLPGGNFVGVDESATRQANLGRDVFADPVAAGNRVVLPLVFTVHGMQKPKQLELRSGVFSAGVRVDVP